MTTEEAKELKKLGRKMLDADVYAEVQRLTDPNAGFGAKMLDGPIPVPEHQLIVDRDGFVEVSSRRPESTVKATTTKTVKEK